MGSRLLPLTLVLGALLADAAGFHHLAQYVALVAVPAAAAAAFVSISDALEGRRALLRALSSGFALMLLVLGSAVRENAPAGGAVPPLAAYALVATLVVYVLPAIAWLLEPVRVRPSHARPHTASVRITPAP